MSIIYTVYTMRIAFRSTAHNLKSLLSLED